MGISKVRNVPIKFNRKMGERMDEEIVMKNVCYDAEQRLNLLEVLQER